MLCNFICHSNILNQDKLNPIYGRVGTDTEPVYGNRMNPTEPVYGTRLPTEPVYGTRLPSEPVYGTRLPSEPVYGTRMQTEPVYGRVTGKQGSSRTGTGTRPVQTVTNPAPPALPPRFATIRNLYYYCKITYFSFFGKFPLI